MSIPKDMQGSRPEFPAFPSGVSFVVELGLGLYFPAFPSRFSSVVELGLGLYLASFQGTGGPSNLSYKHGELELTISRENNVPLALRRGGDQCYRTSPTVDNSAIKYWC